MTIDDRGHYIFSITFDNGLYTVRRILIVNDMKQNLNEV